MSIKVIEGDITTAPVGTLICHQVNCQGIMGAGVALAIARKWPEVERKYRLYAKAHTRGLLGVTILFSTGDGRTVANMFAQDHCGRGNRQTDYESFYNCLEQIRERSTIDTPIAFPYLIGCGLGGGNWNIIRTMIEEVLGDHDVTFYKYVEGAK